MNGFAVWSATVMVTTLLVFSTVLHMIRERKNICSCLHLPAQSGSTAVLERMRRGYTRESYLDLIDHVRDIVPHVCLTSDFICGFCGETEDDFQETISMLKRVNYNYAYLFAYSMREKTTAHRRYEDDVPQSVKLRRCTEMTNVFREGVAKTNQAMIGQLQLVLVEGCSKKSKKHLAGRNDGNTKVILPASAVPVSLTSSHVIDIKPGDYVAVLINDANSQVLKGIPLYHSTLSDFDSLQVGKSNIREPTQHISTTI